MNLENPNTRNVRVSYLDQEVSMIASVKQRVEKSVPYKNKRITICSKTGWRSQR